MKKEQKKIYAAPEIGVHEIMLEASVLTVSGGEIYGNDNGLDGTGNEY